MTAHDTNVATTTCAAITLGSPAGFVDVIAA
jgi:hypothetical protein